MIAKKIREIRITFFSCRFVGIFFTCYRYIERPRKRDKRGAYPLSAPSPQAIARYCPLINCFWGDTRKPRERELIREIDQLKKSGFPPPAQSKEYAKVFRTLKTMNRDHTESRLRPFVRRRASTFRPVGVAIRLRNPWLRERLRFDG